MTELGYAPSRQLPDGTWIGVQRMLTTFGLYVVTDGDSWRTRYCYARKADCFTAFESWDGTGDPAGPWIVQKPEQRMGPGALGVGRNA
jgi:hypothetical protein